MTQINIEMDYLTLSHELRIPLAEILGMAELLKTEELSNLQKEEVSAIQFAGKRLLSMIDTILSGEIQGSEAHRFFHTN